MNSEVEKKPFINRAGNIIMQLAILIAVIGFMKYGIKLAFDGSDTPAVTREAKITTSRNAFITSCQTGDKTESQCACIHDKMAQLHGDDWLSDSTYTDKWTKDGLTKQETDAAVPCMQ